MIHRSKAATIVFVVFAALLIHVAAMFWIKDMQIDFSTSGRALMENQKRGDFDHEQEAAKQEEIKRKNQQLAEVLKNIVQEHYEEQNLTYDMQNVQAEEISIAMEVLGPKLSPGEESVLEDEMGLGSDHELIDSLASATHSINEEKQSSKYLRRPTTVEILYPHDEYLAEELIMATEMALGRMEPDVAEHVILTQSIKAGKIEDASLKGLSMQNRSGMLDQGLAEAVMGSGGSFSLASEFGIWNYHAFSQKKPKVFRDALLPKTNKDELRGFDYNSLGAIASSDDFNLAVEYSPRKEGGYIFKLELFPKPGVKFKRVKHNVFFLVDRSNSIRFTRYEITKAAVAKALALLHAGDTFNVLVFDDSIVRLSPQNLSWSSANVNYARSFISNQKPGGVFASTDLYSSLGMIVPEAVAENEVNTAILLSDGDTYLSSDKQRSSIGSWTKQNSGKVSLYAVASGKGNHLALLDLLSVINKGSLHYSTTDRGLEGTLFNLIQSIRNPIGKDVTVTTLPSVPNMKIEIYPVSQFLPNLYENIPYVVYGVIERLADFHVFFQGRYYDKFLDIKQKVDFKNAKKVDGAGLEKKWVVQQAYVSYSKYLEDGRPEHLIHAKQLLTPHRIPTAFN